MYIPDNIEDKVNFDKKLEKHNITKEELKAFVRHDKYKEHRNDEQFLNICSEIRRSFDKCLNKDGYRYGSLNYIRSNGKRINWINDYYKKLKRSKNYK